MEDKRKPFNINNFISNEETPVETRIGDKVIIYNTNRISNDDYQICGDILSEGQSLLSLWLKDGHFYKTCRVNDRDLFFSPKKTTRRMTNRELSFWLIEHPEEHREFCYKTSDGIFSTYSYWKDREFHECSDSILIRYNGGEWKEPLIEMED